MLASGVIGVGGGGGGAGSLSVVYDVYVRLTPEFVRRGQVVDLLQAALLRDVPDPLGSVFG